MAACVLAAGRARHPRATGGDACAFNRRPISCRARCAASPRRSPWKFARALFVAYGALVAASTLGILYLYRGRAFVVLGS